MWANPILWREIRTLAYGRRPLLVKLAFGIVLALICTSPSTSCTAHGGRRSPPPTGWCRSPSSACCSSAPRRSTSITSERDGGALDLLLVTDISPKEFVFGKLGGVLYNTKEFLLPPLLLAIYYAVAGRAGVHARRTRSRSSDNFGPLLVRARGASPCCSRS